MIDILAALALRHGDYRSHGYTVERYHAGGWLLFDPDGSQLMIGSCGGLAPRKTDAMLEAYSRIDQDARIVAEIASGR